MFVAPLIGERRVDGAVFVDPIVEDPFVDAVRRAGIPFVSIGGRFLDGSSDHWVDNDHASICEGVRDHLARRGYRRPALLTMDGDISYIVDYTVGFARAFSSDQVAVASRFTPHAAMQVVRDALRSEDPPDAFFCVHDQLALAASAAVEVEGLRIGCDVGIVGIGDSLVARQAPTPLSSVNVFPERFGAPAVEMLDGLITDTCSPAPVLIPSRLVPRASTQGR